MMNRILFRTLLIVALSYSSHFSGEANVTRENVVQLPVKNDPTVAFRLWFKVGSQNDPVGKEGLAAITAAMITEGATKNNSYEEILDKLFPLASSYFSSVATEMTIIAGRTHKDNLGEFLPLFLDAVLRPAFEQKDLDRIKSQAKNYIENTLRYSSDEELGKAVLYNEIFSGTRYGHIIAGTVSGIESITVDDVRNFYNTYFTRENVVIGVGGGFGDTLVKRLQDELGTLRAGKPDVVAKPTPQPLNGFKVSIIEKDAASTAISMGFPINLLRGSKEWYALAIANSWLGEHRNSSSHLYQVIREERGLNYGDYSYIEHFPNSGAVRMPRQNVARHQQIFEIWIRPVPNETRHFVLRAALREFKHLVEKGMNKTDFDLTRRFLKKYVLHYAPTTMERLGYALDDKFYGLKESHLVNFRRMMDEVTLKEVNDAIRKHWQYGSMQIAIVTKDAEALKEALVKDLPSPITYQTPKPQSVLDEDREIGVFPLSIDPSEVKIVPVKDLFVK